MCEVISNDIDNHFDLYKKQTPPIIFFAHKEVGK